MGPLPAITTYAGMAAEMITSSWQCLRADVREWLKREPHILC